MIPLRCLCCGNAVLRPRLEHEADASEVACSLCPECDDGGSFEELFYGMRDGRLLPYVLYMQETGREP